MFIFASQWDNHPFFSLEALAVRRAILGPFGIYEVLTAPHGRLSGSHITLDLPAHEPNTHQTTQTHRWSLHQQPVRFSIIAAPGRGHCSAVSTQRVEPQRDGRLRIPASKSWKNPKEQTSVFEETHTHDHCYQQKSNQRCTTSQ